MGSGCGCLIADYSFVCQTTPHFGSTSRKASYSVPSHNTPIYSICKDPIVHFLSNKVFPCHPERSAAESKDPHPNRARILRLRIFDATLRMTGSRMQCVLPLSLRGHLCPWQSVSPFGMTAVSKGPNKFQFSTFNCPFPYPPFVGFPRPNILQ